ncbi:MAG: chromosomal replication initiator protein [Limisphaerales bacterium]|nr:MAG: chromosomal replication initiator protein [Limisphaerales bacterium]KAG0509074.1 MAG: chromosomal replication initiator protein [Limisphaerales bacterium]TXT50781.1 MAG: chromosomal replication initiator protein [Limisphaerales bacterium]
MQPNAEKIWSAAQENLRSLLNPEIYNLWFAPVRAVGMDAAAFTLEVADDFCEVWLKDNYLGLLRDVIASATGKQLEVRFRVSTHAPTPNHHPVKSKLVEAAVPAAARTSNHAPQEADPAFNPRNTFDTFVVGNNQFAHSAALAVAQAPGKSYNPLFLYGGVGLGKTHLLHAIGHHVAAHKKGARVVYMTTEKFTNEFIAGLQDNSLARFRKKYRQTDLLLIDDVQFLAGKERIQEEFFHTFNALHEGHKQIVLTCDRPASEIQGLEQRLVSRFEWGLVTDLQPPDVETRMAILRKRAAAMGSTLPDDIADFLANRIRTNIRRLEGALIRVVSYASLTGKPMSIEVAENLLRDVLHEESRFTLSIEVIQKRVAEHFDLRIADMTSKRRPENIAFPRQIAMFLSRQMTESSLNTIGEAFGGRDHGTVLHACRLVKDRMEVDSGVRQTVMLLEKKLRR